MKAAKQIGIRKRKILPCKCREVWHVIFVMISPVLSRGIGGLHAFQVNADEVLGLSLGNDLHAQGIYVVVLIDRS